MAITANIRQIFEEAFAFNTRINGTQTDIFTIGEVSLAARIGILTNDPQATFDINGSLKAATAQLTTGATANGLFKCDATGLGSWTGVTAAGLQIYHGIETAGALSFDNSSHVVTIAAGGTTYWCKGVKYTTASAITCDLDSYVTLTARTLYFIYFDDTTGTLKADTSWNFYDDVFVATVFWNGSAGALQTETHAYNRDIAWHMWAHDTVGARIENNGGFGLTLPTAAADDSLQIEVGTFHDEDLEKTTTQQTTMRGWYQYSAGVYTFTDYATPYIGTVLGTPQFLRTSDYSLQNVGASNFACYWIFATLDVSRTIYVIPTQAAATYNTIALARAETPPSLTALNVNPEMKLLYKLIYKGDGEFQEATDYRTSSTLPSGGVASTAAASVTFAPEGNISSTNVQDAIAELDTEKAAVGQTMYIGTTAVAINRASAALTLAGITLTTPDIGTPSAGTLTNCTGLPVAGIVSSTVTALGVGTLELGHASDTTLSRSSAGVLAVESVVIPSISSTNTLTNKRVTPRVGSTGTSGTPTINTDDYDCYSITALAAAITSMTTNLSGTPTNFQKLIIRIKDDGTARAIAWGTSFEARGVALPTTTVISKVLTVGFIYDTVSAKWGCVASAQEA
jgi:hypothetical protein